MKILHLTLDYRPSIGGIATHIENLNRFLREQGVDSKVLHIVENSEEEGLENYGDTMKFHIKGDLKDLNKFLKIGKIRRVIDYVSPDMVHVHSFNALEFVVYRWKYPWVWTAHFSSLKEFAESKSLKDRLVKVVLKRIYRDASAIIAVSKFMKDVVSKLTDNPRIFVIPSGVDVERFRMEKSREEIRRMLGIPAERKVIFFPSRWVPFKGLHILMDAMDILKRRTPDLYRKTLLLLTGKGAGNMDYIRDMEKRIENHSDNVVVLDTIPPHEMPLYYSASDIVVIPSVKEPLGIVVLEALASGVPVIASRTGGIPDIIEDGVNGILFEEGNPEHLFEKLKELLENEKLATYLSRNGLKTAERFSWREIASRVKALYESVTR